MNLNNIILIGGFLILFSCGASKNGADSTITEPDNKMSKNDEQNMVDEPNPSASIIAKEEIQDSVQMESDEAVPDVTTSSPWSIVALKDYSVEEEVKITFTNAVEQSVTIYNPLRKNIERLVDQKWVPVEVIYCRCRPCPAPPESREVRPGKSYSVKWSKKEDSCANGQFSQTACKQGSYRIRIDYVFKGKRLTEAVEFTI